MEISASALAKDLGQKKTIYATAGVREYWVLDLVQWQLIVFRHPEETDYQSRVELKNGTIAPLAFPEVEISVSQLLG